MIVKVTLFRFFIVLMNCGELSVQSQGQRRSRLVWNYGYQACYFSKPIDFKSTVWKGRDKQLLGQFHVLGYGTHMICGYTDRKISCMLFFVVNDSAHMKTGIRHFNLVSAADIGFYL